MDDNRFLRADDGQGRAGKNDKLSEVLIIAFVIKTTIITENCEKRWRM